MIQGDARARRWHRPRWWLLVVAALGAAGCDRLAGGEAELRPRPLVALGARVEPGAALALDREGRFWLAAGDSLRVVEPTGWRTVAAARTGARGALRLLGGAGEAVYLHDGERLLALDLATGQPRGERQAPPAERIALDPRGRQLLLALPSAAVYGLEPATLEPLWAWPRLGVEPLALAASPEGDRLYLAVRAGAEGGGDATRLLTRDLQTGRLLARSELPFRLRLLAGDARGTLYALLGGDDAGEVAALRPGPEGAREQWRVPLASPGHAPGAELRVSPAGDRLALFSRQADGGLQLLDARTGVSLGRIRTAPLDAAFGADGTLYLLYAEEIRVVR